MDSDDWCHRVAVGKVACYEFVYILVDALGFGDVECWCWLCLGTDLGADVSGVGVSSCRSVPCLSDVVSAVAG